MSDAPTPATRARVRTRAQLLQVLHDDPRSVSREEIKAAFADGRLGDQDLDIPVLAGMRRITELLAELHPDDAGVTEPAAATVLPRPGGVAVRLTELEERVGRLESVAAAPATPAVPSPTMQDIVDLRASLARVEASLDDRDHRVRQLSMAVVICLGVAIMAVLLAVLTP